MRMLVLPLQSPAIQAYIGAISYGRIIPSVLFNDAYADIKVLDIRHDDEGSPADSVQWMYEPPAQVPVRTMNRAQVFAQGVYVGLTESVAAMKNTSEVPTILQVKTSRDLILKCSKSVEAAAAAAMVALSSSSNVSKPRSKGAKSSKRDKQGDNSGKGGKGGKAKGNPPVVYNVDSGVDDGEGEEQVQVQVQVLGLV